MRFPDAGSLSVWDHCGANIYANDVFKKIKDLIGWSQNFADCFYMSFSMRGQEGGLNDNYC